jgi:hypothetical protein
VGSSDDAIGSRAADANSRLNGRRSDPLRPHGFWSIAKNPRKRTLRSFSPSFLF